MESESTYMNPNPSVLVRNRSSDYVLFYTPTPTPSIPITYEYRACYWLFNCSVARTRASSARPQSEHRNHPKKLHTHLSHHHHNNFSCSIITQKSTPQCNSKNDDKKQTMCRTQHFGRSSLSVNIPSDLGAVVKAYQGGKNTTTTTPSPLSLSSSSISTASSSSTTTPTYSSDSVSMAIKLRRIKRRLLLEAVGEHEVGRHGHYNLLRKSSSDDMNTCDGQNENPSSVF